MRPAATVSLLAVMLAMTACDNEAPPGAPGGGGWVVACGPRPSAWGWPALDYCPDQPAYLGVIPWPAPTGLAR